MQLQLNVPLPSDAAPAARQALAECPPKDYETLLAFAIALIALHEARGGLVVAFETVPADQAQKLLGGPGRILVG
jgi:hypothetical protein